MKEKVKVIMLDDVPMSFDKLSYPIAYHLLQTRQVDAIRLPQWSPDVFIKAQFPDEHSKMTSPYTYVESRFGKVPHKTTVIEEFAQNWEAVIYNDESK